MESSSFSELLSLLELPSGASIISIQTAYRRKALTYHPDKGGDEEKMKRLNALMELFKESQDLYCSETLDDEETPDDSAYASASYGGNSQTPTDPGPSPSVSPIKDALIKLMDFKAAMECMFAANKARRKQCLDLPLLHAERLFNRVPWEKFNPDFF
uniref:Small t antigen n=1 Tax=kestrel polyomavirus 1 TaxID=3074466 RepID=A0AA51Z3M9_9POLY|nr:putative small t antigen [kestrel polyomavirus 1]